MIERSLTTGHGSTTPINHPHIGGRLFGLEQFLCGTNGLYRSKEKNTVAGLETKRQNIANQGLANFPYRSEYHYQRTNKSCRTVRNYCSKTHPNPLHRGHPAITT